MKAYPIIWENTSFYNDRTIMIGSLHLIPVYFKMVGKKIDGSRFSGVLLGSGLMSSGSLLGVLSGKNHFRAKSFHKTI